MVNSSLVLHLVSLADTDLDIMFYTAHRHYIFPRVFIFACPKEQKKEAITSIKNFFRYCQQLEIAYPIIIASILNEEKEHLSAIDNFIKDPSIEWMQAVTYLAYGNSDIEKNIKEEDFIKAKAAGLIAMQAILNEKWETK